jgi:hypothetical protein
MSSASAPSPLCINGVDFFNAWHQLLKPSESPRGQAVTLCAASAAYLTSDDSRQPAPVGSIPLLPGDARRLLLASGEADVFSPALPGVEEALHDALTSLSGDGALPRACGAAPIDACWICPVGDLTTPLRACCVSDVWTLLKASDLVRDAIGRSRARGEEPWIELRAWHYFNSQSELRGFLRASDGAVSAISRRRLQEAATPELSRAVREDNGASLVSRFSQLCQDRNLTRLAVECGGLFVDFTVVFVDASPEFCVLDVGLSRRRCAVDSLLFSWDEIENSSPESPPLVRLKSDSSATAAGVSFTPLAAHAFPDDVFDFARVRLGDKSGSPSDAVVRAAERAAGASSGGWAGLIDDLLSQNLFAANSSDEEDGDDAPPHAG